MQSIIVQIGIAMLLACGAGTSWGEEASNASAPARYQHTRCVVLAYIPGPEQLAPLADEIEYLRELGAPDIVVVLAGASHWPGLDDNSARAARRLLRSADKVLPEWRTGREKPSWLSNFDPPVPSALMETAYWQDQGYRLLPYEYRGQATPSPSSHEPPAPASDKSRLRFSW